MPSIQGHKHILDSCNTTQKKKGKSWIKRVVFFGDTNYLWTLRKRDSPKIAVCRKLGVFLRLVEKMYSFPDSLRNPSCSAQQITQIKGADTHTHTHTHTRLDNETYVPFRKMAVPHL